MNNLRVEKVDLMKDKDLVGSLMEDMEVDNLMEGKDLVDNLMEECNKDQEEKKAEIIQKAKNKKVLSIR